MRFTLKIFSAVLYSFAISAACTRAEINVYFNKSVNTSYAYPGNEATGNFNLAQVVYDRINAAQYSIDIAVYSFDYNITPTPLSTALINAYDRGVIIRVVYDNRSIQNGIQYLINAGIPIIQRTDSEGLMHNKFYIFDARDASSTADDWVVTGSWNATVSGTWDDCQNIVEIQDAALAAAYTIEFQEMWGSSGNYPNTANARFGNNKLDNTPHNFTIDGIPVELYFSPSDGTTSHIIQQVQSGQSSACFALLVFTRSDIAANLYQQWSMGAAVYGILDDITSSGNQWNYLNTFADVYHWTFSGIFHHKYAFFDYDLFSSNPAALTGSHNWSNAAEYNNDENTIIIKSAEIVNQYTQEFAARMAQFGAILPPPPTAIVNDLFLEFYQNDVGISWTAVQGAVSYNVYAASAANLPWEQWELLGNTTGTMFFDEDAFAEGSKFYRVTVVN